MYTKLAGGFADPSTSSNPKLLICFNVTINVPPGEQSVKPTPDIPHLLQEDKPQSHELGAAYSERE